MTDERCREILSQVINHVTSCRNEEESARELLLLGFTKEELVEEYGFDEDEVAEAAKEFEDDVIYTFNDLQNCFDFDTPNNLLHAEGSDWEIEISTHDGRNIKIYKRYSENGNFLKKLVIRFYDNGTVLLIPTDGSLGKRLTGNINLMSSFWYDELFEDSDFGKECAAFLNEFVKTLTNI